MNKLKTLSLLSLVAFSNAAFGMTGAGPSSTNSDTHNSDLIVTTAENAYNKAYSLQKRSKFTTLTLSALVGSGAAYLTRWAAEQKDFGYTKLAATASFLGASWLTYRPIRKFYQKRNATAMANDNQSLRRIIDSLDPQSVTSDTPVINGTPFIKHSYLTKHSRSWFDDDTLTTANRTFEAVQGFNGKILEKQKEKAEAATVGPAVIAYIKAHPHEVGALLQPYLDKQGLTIVNISKWNAYHSRITELATSITTANRELDSVKDQAGTFGTELNGVKSRVGTLEASLQAIENLGLKARLDAIDAREHPIAGNVDNTNSASAAQ